MKSIKQRYAARLPSIPTDRGGRPDPCESARRIWEEHCAFFATIHTMIDPQGRLINLGCAGRDFYENCQPRLSKPEMDESNALIKQFLGVDRLSFNTGFKVREVLQYLLPKAMTLPDVDIAVCVVLELVRLELGGKPDPEYGFFSRSSNMPENKSLPREDDGEDMGTADLDDSVPYNTSDYRMSSFVFAWEKTIQNPAGFERKFPGMSSRRVHVSRVLRPVFKLDPVLDYQIIGLTLESVQKLLKSPFEETRLITLTEKEPIEVS